MKRRNLLKSLGLLFVSTAPIPNLIGASPPRSIPFKREIDKCREDIVYFAENYVIPALHPNDRFKLFGKQREILRACVTGERVMVKSSRRTGKTLIGQIYCVWRTVLFPNTKVGYLSINYHTSMLHERSFSRILNSDLIKSLMMTTPETNVDQNVVVRNRYRYRLAWLRCILLPNGSSISLINVLTPDRKRFFTELISDEVAFNTSRDIGISLDQCDTPEYKLEKVVHLTTPNPSDNNWFRRKWRRIDNLPYTRINMKWNHFPGRDQKWKAEMMELGITPKQWLSEFEARFI